VINYLKPILSALLAVLALAFAFGTASALRSIRLSTAEGATVTASSQLTFIGTELEAGKQIICDVTLLRTVSKTLPKTAGTPFGRITGVAIDRGSTTRLAEGTTTPNCRVGALVERLLDITPLLSAGTPASHREAGRGILLWNLTGSGAGLWTLIYDSISGTLPEIEKINLHIEGLQWLILIKPIFLALQTCLYLGSAFGEAFITRRVTTGAGANTALTALALQAGSGSACPPRGTFRGNFSINPAAITIELL